MTTPRTMTALAILLSMLFLVGLDGYLRQSEPTPAEADCADQQQQTGPIQSGPIPMHAMPLPPCPWN